MSPSIKNNYYQTLAGLGSRSLLEHTVVVLACLLPWANVHTRKPIENRCRKCHHYKHSCVGNPCRAQEDARRLGTTSVSIVVRTAQ